MNNYILKFSRDGKIERITFEAADDDHAKMVAREKFDSLQGNARGGGLRYPNLYREIFGWQHL